MKQLFFLFFIISLINSTLSAQQYFVSFIDKDTINDDVINNTLSPRAITRRNNQNIIPDLTDMPVKQNYLDSISSYGIEILNISKWMNGVLINASGDTLIEYLNQKTFINYIHDVTKTSTGGISETDTSSYGSSWTASEFFDIPQFHNNFNYGEDKMIAVFDGGFLGVNTSIPFSHLTENDKITDTYDFAHNNVNVYAHSSHGTKVLSLISAYEENKFIGFSYESKIALYVTENISEETILEHYNWLFAAERADSVGVDIINSSLGYYDYDYSSTNHTFDQLDGNTSVITKAAQIAAQKGILVISSAGNSNTSNAWPYINFPGDAPDILTVGNITYDGAIVSSSSRGPINNTYFKPEIVAPGANIYVINSDGNISTASGTSFSTPIITGLASLTWNANPDLTAKEIKTLIISNSSQSDTPNHTKGYGYPITNKILGLGDSISLEVKSVFYTSTLGHQTNVFPTHNGIYIKTTIYTNGSKLTQKIMVL